MAKPTIEASSGQHAFAAPPLECAVAITSGLAGGRGCPPRVFELAGTHRLRSVRGNSAGASAAAFVAAAEFGREVGGFEKLKALDAWLEDGDHLRGLFQPSRATRPLLVFLLALERRGRTGQRAAGVAGLVAGFWRLFPAGVQIAFDVIPGALREALPMRYWIATVLGALVGGVLDVLLARGIVDPSHPLARTIVAIVLPVMFIGSYVASFAACVSRLWQIGSVELPGQEFGLCTGLSTGRDPATPALTDWMHARIQDLAGLPLTGPPLTVGALRTKRIAGSGADVGIEFGLVTTSLSLGRSVVLPGAAESLLFREADMRGLFPATIVDHLVAHARPHSARHAATEGCRALPAADDLPLLVLARMSLNLPALLSAVPLHVASSAPGAGTAERVWFADGGLAKESPMTFLTTWLPARPEFRIRLWQPATPATHKSYISAVEAGELERLRASEPAGDRAFFALE